MVQITQEYSTRESQRNFNFLRTGTWHVQSLVFWGSTLLSAHCSVKCICCRDPLRTIKSTNCKTANQGRLHVKGALIPDGVDKLSTEALLHFHPRKVTHSVRVCWKPPLYKNRVFNAAPKGPGPGCGKDNSHFLSSHNENMVWLFGKWKSYQLKPDSFMMLSYSQRRVGWRLVGWTVSCLREWCLKLILYWNYSPMLPLKKEHGFCNVQHTMHIWVSLKCFEIKVTSWAYFVLFETVSLI